MAEKDTKETVVEPEEKASKKKKDVQLQKQVEELGDKLSPAPCAELPKTDPDDKTPAPSCESVSFPTTGSSLAVTEESSEQQSTPAAQIHATKTPEK